MLFSLFIKRKKNKLIKKHIESFQDSFTEEQKIPILASLFLIANSDDEFHDSEKEFLQKFSDAFGYQITDEIMDKYSQVDMDSLFEELSKLSSSQKEWLVISVFGMIHADNMVLEEELLLAKKFFTKMGYHWLVLRISLKKEVICINILNILN